MFTAFLDGFAGRRIEDNGEVTKRCGKCAGMKKFCIRSSRSKMAVVSEAATTKHAMKLEGIKVSASFTPGWDVAWLNRRKGQWIGM